MNIAELAIRRPVFITCLVILMLSVGVLSFFRLPTDQFPNVEIPYISVTVVYPGAGPEEMASLVAKPIEDEVRTIAGIQNVMSFNREGISHSFFEFTLETQPAEAEQQVRDKVALAKVRMPKEVQEPMVQRFGFSDQAIVTMALRGPRSRYELFEIADRKIKPEFEQVSKVSRVDIFGGAKREIQVLLDRDKLAEHEISVNQVGQALEMGGSNIPLGKRPDPGHPGREWIYRSLGEFNSLEKIRTVIVSFFGNDIPTRLSDLGQVVDGHREETSKAFLNGEPTLVLEIYRQNGANTVAVADQVRARMQELNAGLLQAYPGVSLTLVRDGAKSIRDNIVDVSESILIGILLTVVVVFFFLGNVRSTLITGVALPNSLIGAFVLISAAGFSVNTMTLLALSLSVGLLIDDAIVVRENIFRHIELGQPPRTAALEGTQEVMLAVIATTLAVVSVFGPIAFVSGITGKFLREFGLTICFIMAISLFDALTMGPMLSALFAGRGTSRFALVRFFSDLVAPAVRGFDRFQNWLEKTYAALAEGAVQRPGRVLVVSLILVAASFFTLPFIPKTFMPVMNSGEFTVRMELPPGSSLAATEAAALAVEKRIRAQREVALTSLVIGAEEGDPAQAGIYVLLKPFGERKLSSSAFKQSLRQELAEFKDYRLTLTNFDTIFGGQRPFVLRLLAGDQRLLEAAADQVLQRMRQFPGFVEPDTSYRQGKPELRLTYDEELSKRLGVTTSVAGAEMRAQIEGITPAKFREQGEEWDVRVRLRDEDRDLQGAYPRALIPNLNHRLVRLAQVARLEAATGVTTIYRQNGLRTISLTADIGKGYGVGELMDWVHREAKGKDLIPPGVRYEFSGQGEQHEEMMANMLLAAFLAVLFIYLVLASLYESFLTPFALLLPLPLALSGAFVALWLSRETLNIYSMIATIMLLGIATKNSILLIDYTNQLIRKGKTLAQALVEAGRVRLRPILMTSMALIAGTLPVAIGLNEASKQRSSMGWVIIGGVISSTLLSLVVVPATLTLFRGRETADTVKTGNQRLVQPRGGQAKRRTTR
jgi:hydrophobic/amphiphilic exporter-1 (mainly G- bacteria), HAE1 family